MKEIAPEVFIETTYPGVTLAALRLPHGLLYIDAPLYGRDSQAWRSSLTKPGTSSDRMLILLDEHLDRTIGAKAMKCTTIAHEKAAILMGNRTANTKPLGIKTGAQWEYCEDLGTIHWAQAEITFTHSMFINWSDEPVEFEHHAGPSKGSSWVIVPSQKVVFIGDTVVLNQPPFLASADLEAWLATLTHLRSAKYRDYIIISGRGELVTQEDAKMQGAFLKRVQSGLEKISHHGASPQETEHLAQELLSEFTPRKSKELEMFKARLTWGVQQQYNTHYHPSRQTNNQ